MLLSFTIVGVITSLMGNMLGVIVIFGTIIVRILFIINGSTLINLMPLPQLEFFSDKYISHNIHTVFFSIGNISIIILASHGQFY